MDSMVRCSKCLTGSAEGATFLHCGNRLHGVEMPRIIDMDTLLWTSGDLGGTKVGLFEAKDHHETRIGTRICSMR